MGWSFPGLLSERCRPSRSRSTVTEAIQALKGLMDDAPASGEIFNVGSTNRISITDLAERVKEMTRSESDIVYLPYEEVYGQGIEDMLHRIPAIDKIHDRIGWEPTLDP